MANITDEDVRKVIRITDDLNAFPELDLDFHIETADLVVMGRLSDVGYSTALLDKITAYLAAHFASLYIREPEEAELGDSREKYTRELKTGLESTRFGHNALALDWKGILISDQNNRYSGSLHVIL